MAGAGSLVWFVAGVAGGTRAANIAASRLLKLVLGRRRWITIRPVRSSVSIPLIPPFLVLLKRSAPAITVYIGDPGELILNRRSTVDSKSEALTGVPSEYSSPGRRKSVYVLPPSEICGSDFARPGISFVPAVPLACS